VEVGYDGKPRDRGGPVGVIANVLNRNLADVSMSTSIANPVPGAIAAHPAWPAWCRQAPRGAWRLAPVSRFAQFTGTMTYH